jgi:hypothetical protein
MQTAQGCGDLHEALDDEAGDLMLEELRHGRAQAFGQVSVLFSAYAYDHMKRAYNKPRFV